MGARTRAPRFQDQTARPGARRGYLGMGISLDHLEYANKSYLEFDLLLLALTRVRQVGDEPEPGPQLSDRLGETRFCHGLAARTAPISSRLLEETGSGKVVRHGFGPRPRHVGKPLFERKSDPCVQ